MELIAQAKVATGVLKGNMKCVGGYSKRSKPNLLKEKRKQGEGKVYAAGRQEMKRNIIRTLTQIVRKA